MIAPRRLPVLDPRDAGEGDLLAPHRPGEPWPGGGVVSEVRQEGGRWLLELRIEEEALQAWLDPRDPAARAFASAGPFRVGYARQDPGPTPAMYAFLRRVASRIDANAAAGPLPLPAAAAIGLRAPSRVPLDREHLLAHLDEAVAAHGAPIEDVVVIVTNPCDMGCVFCPAGDIKLVGRDSPFDHEAEFEELRFQIGLNDRLGARRLHINGNDPLRHPRLGELVALGRAHDFERVVIQTPGLLLDDPARARSLSDAGVTDVEMPFYAHRDDVFAAVTGVQGAFTRADRAVRNLLDVGIEPHLHGLAIDATLPHVRSTFEHVTRVLGLPWEVGHYKPHHIDTARHRWLPSYTAVRDAIAACPEAFPATPLGFPLCLYPEPPTELREPLEGRPLNLFHWSLPYAELDAALWRPTLDRVFPDGCSGCAARERCPGTYQAHLDLPGAGELSPLPAVAPAP